MNSKIEIRQLASNRLLVERADQAGNAGVATLPSHSALGWGLASRMELSRNGFINVGFEIQCVGGRGRTGGPCRVDIASSSDTSRNFFFAGGPSNSRRIPLRQRTLHAYCSKL
jgi:hypothetical protein